MKIIAGKFKKRNFFLPKGVRATQDVVRKALFDILGQDLEEVSFLELFAGSGAVGLEAISRGASRVVFVEKDPRAAEIIDLNIQRLNIKSADSYDDSYHVINSDVFIVVKQLAQVKKKFVVVFVDPPYGAELGKKTLKLLAAYDILQPDSSVVIQHDKHENLPDNEGRFFANKERKYGGTVLTFYEIK